MKRNYLKSLLLLLGATSALSAVAYDVHVESGYYNLNKSDATASLTYLFFYRADNAEAYVGDLVIPETIEHDGVTYTVTEVDARAFFDCKKLTSIELPSTVTAIGSNAFINCTALKSVKFPEKLVKIENAAFLGCSSLESAELPTTLVSLGTAAFSGCSSLQHVDFPPYLSVIGSNAFFDCAALTHIDLPRGLTEIGLLAFAGCTGLESVVFPDNVKSIKVTAFENCTNLKKIELGRSIYTLDAQCFYGCTSLEDVYCKSATSPVELYSSAFSNTPRLRLHVPNEGVENYHKVDTWRTFASIMPLQCAVPVVELGDESLTFTTATNLSYAQIDEVYDYTVEVSDLSSGSVADEALASLGTLALTYDVRVKTTAEGCEDSEEVTAQFCWLGSDVLLDDKVIDAPATQIGQPTQRPVLVTTADGTLTVTGLAEGQRVEMFDLGGRRLGAATVTGGRATLSAAVGQVVVLSVAGSSFKIRVN